MSCARRSAGKAKASGSCCCISKARPAAWNVSSGSGGQYDVRGTCTQSGSFPGGPLKLRVHAMLTVAANGRSVSGTVQVVGHVAGTSFQSPPTRFSSRYIGACKGR